MDYHARNKSGYGVVWMLEDGYTFGEIEEKWVDFKGEPLNVRLSLWVDGVNLYAHKRYIYLVWPIFVIKNKIPPWLSINTEQIMLGMIILGMCLQQLFFWYSGISLVLF